MELGIPSRQSGGVGARPSARRHIRWMNQADRLTQRVEQSVKIGNFSHRPYFTIHDPLIYVCLSPSSVLTSVLILCKKNRIKSGNFL